MNLDKYLNIPIASIKKGQWDLSKFRDGASIPLSLRNSFVSLGVITPPTVKIISDEKYELICGKKRLHAASSILNQESCVCRVLPKESHPYDIIIYILEEQLTSRPLSIIEQANLLTICNKSISRKKIFNKIMPQMGLKGNSYIYDNIVSLLDFDKSIQSLIHNEFINAQIALELNKLCDQDRMTLANLFSALKLGAGKQKRILALCKDIAYRQKIKIGELLNQANFQKITDNIDVNPPQKTSQLLKLLQEMCYPRMTFANNQFNKQIDELKLPSYVTITHTKSFEKPDMKITIQCKNISECKKILEKIGVPGWGAE